MDLPADLELGPVAARFATEKEVVSTAVCEAFSHLRHDALELRMAAFPLSHWTCQMISLRCRASDVRNVFLQSFQLWNRDDQSSVHDWSSSGLRVTGSMSEQLRRAEGDGPARAVEVFVGRRGVCGVGMKGLVQNPSGAKPHVDPEVLREAVREGVHALGHLGQAVAAADSVGLIMNVSLLHQTRLGDMNEGPVFPGQLTVDHCFKTWAEMVEFEAVDPLVDIIYQAAGSKGPG